MEAPTNPFIQARNAEWSLLVNYGSGGPAGPTREPFVLTTEDMTVAVAIMGMIVLVVSCLCIMAKLDWGKISGRSQRKRRILIKKAAKKLEAEGRLKNADAVAKAKAKKPKETVKKEVKVPNGAEAQPPSKKVIKTEDGKPVVWKSRFEDDGITETVKPEVKETRPSKPGVTPAKKVIKDETGREVPWKPKMQDNIPFMIFELSENPNADPCEKFPWDTAPTVANMNGRSKIANNAPIKSRGISRVERNVLSVIEHTIVESDKEFGTDQLNPKVAKKIVRSDSVDSVDEFFEARRPSDVSLDMSLVMDDITNQPIFVFNRMPNYLRLN